MQEDLQPQLNTNIKDSSKKFVFTKNIILLTSVISVVLIGSISALIFVLVNSNTKSSDGNDTNATTSVFSTNYSNSPTSTISTTTDPYAGWKSYYSKTFDFTIYYPNDYEVTNDSETGSINCADITDIWLKSTYRCIDKVAPYPSITIRKSGNSENNDSVYVFGPAQLGGLCADGSQLTNNSVTINGKKYDFTIKKEPSGEYCSREDSINNITATGYKSIWSQYRIKINATNDVNFQTALKIINSIR